MDIVRIEEVTKIFRLSKKQQMLKHMTVKKKVAVERLSLSIQKGEIFGILGPNGAGKTTTLRMLATLIKPTSGDVFIKDKSIVTHPNEIRNSIGFLTSELKLEGFFTPNFLYDFFSNLQGVDPKQARDRKKLLFDYFGIGSYAEIRVRELSTGMKQKVSLAICLAHDPEIIIFDEPTNGLDIISSRIVEDFLCNMKEQGKTVIISTHIFDLAMKLCDRVGIIIDGKLAGCENIQSFNGVHQLEDYFFELYSDKSRREATGIV